MKDKATTSVQFTQHLIAGLLQNDSSIEFYGLPASMEVEWIQNGNGHSFKDLDKPTFTILSNAYRSNREAREDIPKIRENGVLISYQRQVELYTYLMFGGLDCRPDIVDGVLQEPENFRHSPDCPSLRFKKILLNGCPLKPRELRMIDLMEKDYKHEHIASEMGISLSTYNQHKRELFNKTGTFTRSGLLLAAMRQKILRQFNTAAI